MANTQGAEIETVELPPPPDAGLSVRKLKVEPGKATGRLGDGISYGCAFLNHGPDTVELFLTNTGITVSTWPAGTSGWIPDSGAIAARLEGDLDPLARP